MKVVLNNSSSRHQRTMNPAPVAFSPAHRVHVVLLTCCVVAVVVATSNPVAAAASTTQAGGAFAVSSRNTNQGYFGGGAQTSSSSTPTTTNGRKRARRSNSDVIGTTTADALLGPGQHQAHQALHMETAAASSSPSSWSIPTSPLRPQRPEQQPQQNQRKKSPLMFDQEYCPNIDPGSEEKAFHKLYETVVSRTRTSTPSSSSSSFGPLLRLDGEQEDEVASTSTKAADTTTPLKGEDAVSTTASDCTVRGVYVNRAVPSDVALLSLPLQHCLRDDAPPAWYRASNQQRHHTSDWATRLAASFLDQQFTLMRGSDKGRANTDDKGWLPLWFSLLPEANHLRASLPVHWSDEVVKSARCTALEVAVDTAFFARYEAVQVLMESLTENLSPDVTEHYAPEQLRRLCENALDVVQTRTCRVSLQGESKGSERGGGSDSSLRLLAPIFDFINHGAGGDVNARFALEDDRLVVRATRDIHEDEQVLIDYGDSARPAWKCLASYGFCPSDYQHQQDKNNADDNTDSSPDDNVDTENHVAEVYLNGVRFEVGPTSIPGDMVELLHPPAEDPHLGEDGGSERINMGDEEDRAQQNNDVVLTPEIAIRLSRRISEVAYLLLVDPLDPDLLGRGAEDESDDYDYDEADDDDVDDDEEEEDDDIAPEMIISARLAASLRFYQHRILMALSLELKDAATQGQLSLGEGQ